MDMGDGGPTRQASFSARFVIQWLASERRKRSVLPRAFWYFSLVGGVTLLAYALYLGDPVFIVGFNPDSGQASLALKP